MNTKPVKICLIKKCQGSQKVVVPQSLPMYHGVNAFDEQVSMFALMSLGLEESFFRSFKLLTFYFFDVTPDDAAEASFYVKGFSLSNTKLEKDQKRIRFQVHFLELHCLLEST